ncbi:MAG TPA: aldo/keto reductase [Candidatus Dormibacteraeota bacterium]|jgi:aryl-alcohol dehydrogenase-like predicted oxidoreductase|nr:aldo/keto reductase [Candidatus Dormibacteraeota bacterium]
MLETRPLGRTGLNVTRLGFGAMEIRGERIWGGRQVTDDEAGEILSAVLDAGVTLIDTANDYGKSERYIGEFLADRRGDYVLATKCGCSMVPAGDHDETPHEWHRDHLLGNIDDSLAKLRTDHVDLLQLHNPSAQLADEHKVVDTLNEIRSAGKTRFIGISSTSPHLGTYIDWGVFDAFQIPYSALERRHENLIIRAHEAGAGTIIRGGVARGEPGRGLGSADRWAIWERAGLDELLADGESRTQWQLRFTLSHPGIDTVIAGTVNPAHLAENVRASEAGPLPADVYEEAKRRLDRAGERPE